MLLLETNRVLTEIGADWRPELGVHFDDAIRAGVPGMPLHDVPYNGVHHLPTAINPFSLMEHVTDELYVTEVRPAKPLNLNVVMHFDPEENMDLEWLTEAKTDFAGSLYAAIDSAMPGATDRTYIYVAGDTERAHNHMDYAEEIPDTNDPENAAREIARICATGLTFVLATFKNLPLEKVEYPQFDWTIGVKANHLFEVELQPDVSEWRTGDPEQPLVNTKKRKELKEWNEKLWQHHLDTFRRLGDVGISMSQAIFDPRYKPHNYDVASTDSSIAGALRRAFNIHA